MDQLTENPSLLAERPVFRQKVIDLYREEILRDLIKKMTADMTSAIEEECTAAVADGSFWRDMRYEMVAHQHDVTFAAKNMEGYEEFAAEVRRVEG